MGLSTKREDMAKRLEKFGGPAEIILPHDEYTAPSVKTGRDLRVKPRHFILGDGVIERLLDAAEQGRQSTGPFMRGRR